MRFYAILFLAVLLTSVASFPQGSKGQGTIGGPPALASSESLVGVVEPFDDNRAVLTFSVHRLFANARQPSDLDPKAAAEYHRLIAELSRLGLDAIGTTTTWVFPRFANAPLTPASEFLPDPNVPEARLHCVPDFEHPLYGSLAALRDELFAAIVGEFPEIRIWTVGYDPAFSYYDCAGRQLGLPEMARYMADSLHGATRAVRGKNPKAVVLGHFAGRVGLPIQVAGELLHPAAVQAAITSHVRATGRSVSDYLDGWTSDLLPELLSERLPPTSGRQPDGNATVGWNTKFLEEFNHPVEIADLADSDPNWDPINHGTLILLPTKTNGDSTNGRAILQLADGGGPATVAGVFSALTVDVTPDAEFTSGPFGERNRWMALQDFYPTARTSQVDDSHNGVFLRVNERDWDMEQGNDNQTRFGCYTYLQRQNRTGCSEMQGCAALQLESDSSGPNPSAQLVLNFALTEDPWDYSTHLYRCQIIEYNTYSRIWPQLPGILYWYPEVLDLTDGGQLLGSRSAMSSWTLVNTYGMVIPPLSASRLMFAMGFRTGEEQLERVGTAYWRY